MFEDLFNQSLDGQLTVLSAVFSIVFALVLGCLVSLTYRFTNKSERTENMRITLLILPSLIAVVILFIGDNIAGAFSVAGIFAVIKFRSAAGSSRDILYILFCTAVGLGVGVYEYLISAILTVILCGIMWILHFMRFGKDKTPAKQLKMLMPEDESIEKALYPILTEYTDKFELVKMTTRDLGSVFEVVFLIRMKDERQQKELIDKLRTANGNLKICLSQIINGEWEEKL
jgi:hypothetical protein